MSTNFKTKCSNTKTIFSVALFISAFLALMAVINAAPPRWRPLAPDPNPGSGNGYSYRLFRAGATTVYDPTSNKLILFAGASNDPSPNAPRFNDLWVLTHANGLGGTAVWDNLILDGAQGSPQHRYHHSAVYDVVHNRMTIYGGCGLNVASENCLPIANDVWVLSNANGQTGTPTWTQLFPTGTAPEPRQGHQAVYDPTTNSMIVWGGQNGILGEFCAPYAYQDVYVLTNANGLGGVPHWSRLPTTGGPPPGAFFSTAVYDSSNNIMTVFGGFGLINGDCIPTNSVWALSHANGHGGTPVWTRLWYHDHPGSPPARFQHFAAYLPPPSNKMIIHGGKTTGGSFYNDTWVFSNANGLGGTPAWSRLQIPGNIPGPSSRWNAGGFDPVNNLVIMSFGDGNRDGPQWGAWVLTNP